MGQVQTKAKLPTVDIQIPVAIFEDADTTLTCKTSHNPGTFQALHKQCQNVMPAFFEGIRLIANNPLSNHFQVSHILHVNNPMNVPAYKINSTFVGTNKHPDTEDQYPVWQGDMNTAGTLTANFMHYVTPYIRLQCSGQFSANQPALGQVTADWIGRYFTASLTAVNPDRYMQPSLVAAQYLQAVTSAAAVGVEVVYDTQTVDAALKNRAGRVVSLAAAVRVKNGENLWTATAGTAGIELCAYSRVSESIQFGVEANVNFQTRKSIGMLSYEVHSPKCTFRGMIDSTATVGAVMERTLDFIPLTVSLSASINHLKRNLRLGFGVNVR